MPTYMIAARIFVSCLPFFVCFCLFSFFCVQLVVSFSHSTFLISLVEVNFVCVSLANVHFRLSILMNGIAVSLSLSVLTNLSHFLYKNVINV